MECVIFSIDWATFIFVFIVVVESHRFCVIEWFSFVQMYGFRFYFLRKYKRVPFWTTYDEHKLPKC